MSGKPPADGLFQTVRFKNEGVELELIVNISGFLEGTIEDWPSHIKEPILEELQKEVGRRRALGLIPSDINSANIIMSRCDKDEDGWFIHVVATAVKMRAQEKQHIVKQGRVIH
jgi:hypothetical protein